MQLTYENTVAEQFEHPINLVCVFRDEAILLPHFIDYYKSLGINQFYFIDNNSIDGGSNYLMRRNDINLKLFFTKDSFRASAYGTHWQNACMAHYCQNQFCVRVDADELLLIDSRRYQSLYNLLQEMELTGKSAVPAVLLDMYPKILNNDYQKGQAFSEHSFYFDQFNNQYYHAKKIIFERFYWLVGGLRLRTLNTSNIIHKFPIIKYIFNENTVQPSPHFFGLKGKETFKAPKVKLMDYPVILLHYKFIKPHFLDYLKQQIANDEHWHGSIEYKNYYQSLKDKSEISFYDERYSKKFENIDDLDAFWNINIELLMSLPIDGDMVSSTPDGRAGT